LSSVIQGDRPVEIYAEEVIVDSNVASFGYTVSIVCKRLTFMASATLTVSGRPAPQSYPPGAPAQGSLEAGAHGADGADGGHGTDSGNVRVVTDEIVGTGGFRAEGGDGGRGQDAGSGRQGASGAAGTQLTTVDPNVFRNPPAETRGKKGGRGGNAGLPGRPGPGGHGGYVDIRTRKPITADQIAIQTHGGKPGEPGARGQVGAGGPPGPQGQVIYKECSELSPLEGPKRVWRSNDGEDVMNLPAFLNPPVEGSASVDQKLHVLAARTIAMGISLGHCWVAGTNGGGQESSGDVGDSRDAEVAQRVTLPPLVNGDSVILSGLSLSEYGSAFKDEFLELLLYAIENEFGEAGMYPTEQVKQRVQDLFELSSTGPDTPLRRKVRARATAMTNKIALGLDYYGYSREQVPLFSWLAYDPLVKAAIESAKTVEHHFQLYWDENQAHQERIAALRESHSQAVTRVEALGNEANITRELAQQILLQIKTYDDQVAATFELLVQAENDLNDAIRKKANAGNECGLKQALSAISCVATIAGGISTGGAGFLAAAGGAAKLYQDFGASNDSFQSIWDNRKVLHEDMEVIAKEASTVADALVKIQEAYKQLGRPSSPVTLPRYRMDRDRFDEIAKEFADIPEAEKYRITGYQYLQAVDARNQAIIDYNGSLLRYIDLCIRKDAAGQTAGVILSSLNGETDLASPVLMSSLTGLYMDALALAAHMIHRQRRALGYHYVQQDFKSFSRQWASSLDFAYAETKGLYEQAASAYYRAKRELASDRFKIAVRQMVTDAAWQGFQRTGVLSFTFTRDLTKFPELESLPGLRITGVAIDFPGIVFTAGPTGNLAWRLLHPGYAQVYDSTGKALTFRHSPCPIDGFTPIDSGEPLLKKDFVQDDLYAGLSPFTTWTLALSRNPGFNINMDGLQNVMVTFEGYIVEGAGDGINHFVPVQPVMVRNARFIGAIPSEVFQSERASISSSPESPCC
jgi:hypothetical protein